jgi:integrase
VPVRFDARSHCFLSTLAKNTVEVAAGRPHVEKVENNQPLLQFLFQDDASSILQWFALLMIVPRENFEMFDRMGVIFFHNPRRCPFLLRPFSQLYLRSSIRALRSSWREPLSIIVAVTAVLGLRIGEALALRRCDVDFAKHVIRIRQSVDAATRIPGAVKSKASNADLPMSRELEAKLRAHLQRHGGMNDLLFVNRHGRPFSANKLREKQLHPLLDALRIPRGGFHSMRHGAASSLLEDGATPGVVQRQLRHSDARITLGIYGHVVGDAQRRAVQNRSTRLVN